MKSFLRPALRLALPLCLLPSLALAHPGHEGHDFTWDFSSGFAHPWSGWDHVLAMIAVGLWAAQLGGRARWALPAVFLAIMTAGAALGQAGFVLPGIEQGIAASVIALGLLVATQARLPFFASAGLTAIFALVHGVAHGAEIPETASGLLYGAGFVCATAMLHVTGLGVAALARRQTRPLTEYAGVAIVAVGLVMLAA